MPRFVQRRALNQAWFLDGTVWTRGLRLSQCRHRPRPSRDSNSVLHELAGDGGHRSPSWGRDAGPQASHRFAVPFWLEDMFLTYGLWYR